MTNTGYEYRAAYLHTAATPIGAGIHYGPIESLDRARGRVREAIHGNEWHMKQGRASGLERAWIERRPVGEWEEVEA